MIEKTAVLIVAFAVLGSAGTAAAQNKQKVRKIGFLSVYSQSDVGSRVWHKAFERGLRNHGWVAGKNITIDHRFVRDRQQCKVSGRRACLPTLVNELLALDVELIAVHGGLPARIIQRLNKSIPVVMAEASDAVGRGIVKSRPSPAAT